MNKKNLRERTDAAVTLLNDNGCNIVREITAYHPDILAHQELSQRTKKYHKLHNVCRGRSSDIAITEALEEIVDRLKLNELENG